jgi:site-specific recombinase XerD
LLYYVKETVYANVDFLIESLQPPEDKMTDEQLALFPKGQPGRGTAGEMTRPVASLPADLTLASSLAAAIALFYGHMIRQGFSDNTVKAFQADLRLFSKYIGSNRAIGSIGQADLEEFLTWMRAGRGVPCSPKTYARRMTTLKVFFGWLAEADFLPSDPAAPLIHEHPSTPLPQILYDDQVNALIRTTRDLLWAPKPDARPYLLVSLIFQTGIKKSECMEIRPEHIDLSNPQAPVLYIRNADARRTHKERKLALGPSFAPVYRQYLLEYKPTEHLFECTARNLEYVLEDMAALAGISGGVSFEQLRWTCAVRDYRNGMPAAQLRQKLGISMISWRETLPKIQKLARPPL